MIAKGRMFEVLLVACPSFRPAWQAFVDEWRDSVDGPPLYIALCDLARHLVGMLERGDTETFPAVFAAVERLVVEGEHFVSEAAVVGLLEDLQNLNLYTTTEPEQFRPWLGPESAKAWDELYMFWDRVAEAKAEGLLGLSVQIDPNEIDDPNLRRLVEQIYPRR